MFVGGGRVARWNIDGYRRLIVENTIGTKRDRENAGVSNRIARNHIGHYADFAGRITVFLVIAIDETGKKDFTQAAGSAIERKSGVIEESIGAGAHHRVGSRLKTVHWRHQARKRTIQRVSRQKRTPPCLAAVEGFKNSQPRISLLLDSQKSRQVHAAIIIR